MIPMRLSASPAYFERIANDPTVLPAVTEHGHGPVAFPPDVWQTMLGIEFEGGGWLLQRLGSGYFEVHTLFLPGSRDIREKAAHALHAMFTGTDAWELVTKVPADIPAALGLAKAMGFTERFVRRGAWKREGGAVDIHFLGLTLDEWARDNGTLRVLGHRFHEDMEAAGFPPNHHDDDPVHDCYVGLALACAEKGNISKGVALYNRWARFACYEAITTDGESVFFDGLQVRMENGAPVFKEENSCQSEP